MHQIKELLPGIFQLTIYDEPKELSFNQYLILDDKSALISTGSLQMFDGVRGCIGQVLDPSRINYFVIPHFESDECGALSQFLELSAEGGVICPPVCARQLVGFGICPDPIVVKEYDTVELGKAILKFIYVPWEMHLWDGLIAFEETKGVLFSSDLFGQMGRADGEATERAISMSLNSVPSKEKLLGTLEKVKGLDLRLIAPGHGVSFSSPSDLIEGLTNSLR